MKRPKINRISVKLGTFLFTIFFLLIFIISTAVYLFFINFYTQDTLEGLTERGEAYAEVFNDHFNEEILYHAGLIEGTSSEMIIIVDHEEEILSASEEVYQLDPDYVESILTHGDREHDAVLSSNWKEEDYFVTQSMTNPNTEEVNKIIMLGSTRQVQGAVTFLQGILLIVGILVAAIGAFLIFTTAKKIVQPLLQTIHITKQISKGEYENKLEVKGSDEISELSTSVNHMSDAIQQYQQQNKQFFADISHELRTPITYFKGYVDVLLSGMVSNEEEKKRYLHVLQNQSIQLERLVQDLFDLSSIEQEGFTLQLSRVSLETMIINSLDLVGPSIEESQMALSYDPSPVPLYVEGDAYRLQQVLVNLLENAQKYSDKHTKIKVKLYKKANQGIICVSDTGPGIPEKALPHIWERLYRVEKSRSRSTGGSGLGLTICKKIIELHQGEISVESKEGEGTRFYITLPLLQ